MIFALPTSDDLLGASFVTAKFGLCTMSNTFYNTIPFTHTMEINI
jgi:hypothetical protein